MDALTLILRAVRSAIEGIGAPPDALQDALAEAEARLRCSLGGAEHHISRVQCVPKKARILELGAKGLAPGQIAERVAVSRQYVHAVLSVARDGDCQQEPPTS